MNIILKCRKRFRRLLVFWIVQSHFYGNVQSISFTQRFYSPAEETLKSIMRLFKRHSFRGGGMIEVKQIDVRFNRADMTALDDMLGKRMIKYKCDPFVFSTAVYGIVGIVFDDAAYAFTNLTEVMDYYGENEDVALFKMKKTREADIHSLIRNQEMIDMPIDDIISDILVVNERQRLYDRGQLTYEV